MTNLYHKDKCFLINSHHEGATPAVDMEGASVAHDCEDHQIPYFIIRVISDKADHSAAVEACKYQMHPVYEC